MSLRRLNHVLLVLIIGINAYVALAPLWPTVAFWIANRDGQAAAAITRRITDPTAALRPPTGNRLAVPSMALEEPVHEVPSTASVRDGLWRRPNTSTPDTGSNTVIVGHRFTYTNPTGVFYHLDKVRVGDDIALWWEGKRYLYRVSRTQVVPASQTSVEAPTAIPQLTLYTCTPLWNPTNRLVVTADLQEETP